MSPQFSDFLGGCWGWGMDWCIYHNEHQIKVYYSLWGWQGFPLTVSRDPETPNFSGGIPNIGRWVFLRDTCFLREELHLSFGKYVKRIKNEVFAVKINFPLVLHLSILLFTFHFFTEEILQFYVVHHTFKYASVSNLLFVASVSNLLFVLSFTCVFTLFMHLCKSSQFTWGTPEFKEGHLIFGAGVPLGHQLKKLVSTPAQDAC